jgi:osmotically-inducible protein OsmY
MINTVRIAFAAAIVAAAAGSASYAQSPSEAQTSHSVLAQLNSDAALRADSLHVETVGNTVYISGQVDNSLESQDAVELASRVPTVGKVVDMTSTTSNN